MSAAEKVAIAERSVEPKVGIGSFAYRYATRFRGFDPGKTMAISDSLDTAARGGWEGVRLSEGLGYANRSDADLAVARSALPRLCSQGITLGREVHFALAMYQLLSIVKQLGDEHVGIIFDTTIGMRPLEKPREDLVRAEPCLDSMHIKDRTIRRPKGRSRLFCHGCRIGQRHAGSPRRAAPRRRRAESAFDYS